MRWTVCEPVVPVNKTRRHSNCPYGNKKKLTRLVGERVEPDAVCACDYEFRQTRVYAPPHRRHGCLRACAQYLGSGGDVPDAQRAVGVRRRG